MRVTRGALEKNEFDPIKIVIGVDGSSEAEHAVRAVGRRIWPEGTEVRIIAVDDGTSPARISHILPIAGAAISNEHEESALVAQRMIDWAENELRVIGLNVSVAIEKGDPQRVLIHHAQKWDADAIFVGGAGSAALLNGSGSVASRLDWLPKHIARSRSRATRLVRGLDLPETGASGQGTELPFIPSPSSHKTQAPQSLHAAF